MAALQPAMTTHAPPTGHHARWIGVVDLEQLRESDPVLALANPDHYTNARLLVREHASVRGYVVVPIDGHGICVADVVEQAADLPPAEPWTAPQTLPPFSVVVCTRERPALLRDALESLLAQDYPDFEVIVVDNAPVSDGTKHVAERLGVSYVVAPRPGLARARNVGLAAAQHALVAFTDDDVIADPAWLRGLARGFAHGDDVACVSGLVPTGELRNSVQAYFDARVSWSKVTTRRLFGLDQAPPDLPMFPFCVGEFGTGANFAVRAETVRRLGGFDEALGVGTRTKGGEDLDIFTRVLFGGWRLAVEPDAVIWHRHRADLASLRGQAVGYGRGLGAWLWKVATTPRAVAMAARQIPEASRRLVHKPMRSVEDPASPLRWMPWIEDEAAMGRAVRRIGRVELRQVLVGPLAYVAERIAPVLSAVRTKVGVS